MLKSADSFFCRNTIAASSISLWGRKQHQHLHWPWLFLSGVTIYSGPWMNKTYLFELYAYTGSLTTPPCVVHTVYTCTRITKREDIFKKNQLPKQTRRNKRIRLLTRKGGKSTQCWSSKTKVRNLILNVDLEESDVKLELVK